MSTYLKLLRDAGLALIFHVAPRLANVIIFVVVGRLSGPELAGVFTLATTYLLIATTLMRGLDDLLIRQVAREPERGGNYFGNFLLLRLGLATLAFVALVALTMKVAVYAASTTAVIVTLAFSVIPDSLAHVAQAVLLGYRRFEPPAAVLGGLSVFKLIIGVGVMVRGGSLMDIAWIWLGGSWLGLGVMLMVAVKQVGGWRQVDWRDFGPLKAHWRAAVVFGAATILTALDSQTDTLLLSVLRTEREVGWYGAATTITAGLLMMAQAYRFAVYPAMARYAQSAPDKLASVFQKSIQYMGIVAMPMVTIIAMFAPTIVNLIFGPEFLPTARILQIWLIALLFFFLSEPCNRVMLVKDKQQVLVGFLAISATINIILNLFLIPYLGATGAAIARVCSTLIFFLLNQGYITRRLLPSVSVRRLGSPLLSSILMMIVLLGISQHFMIFGLIVSVLVYILAILLTKGILPDDAHWLYQSISRRIVFKVKS